MVASRDQRTASTGKRSPHFPMISLREAERYLEKLYHRENKALVPREVAAQDLGFSGLNGTANRILGALAHYGLTNEAGPGQLRISELGLGILRPHDDLEKIEQLQKALGNPKIFAAMLDAYGKDGLGSDDTLKNRLIRQHDFTEKGASGCVTALREGLAYIDELTDGISPKPIEARDSVESATDQTLGNNKPLSLDIQQMDRGKFSGGRSIEIPLSETNWAQFTISGMLNQKEYLKLKRWLETSAIPWASFWIIDEEESKTDVL